MGFYAPGPWESDLANIEKSYTRSGLFLVGTINEAIVAMGAYRKLDRKTAEIKRMRVHPKYQRRGYAQKLLETLENDIAVRGFRKIILDTTNRQIPAIKLYEKNGYKKVGQKDFAESSFKFTLFYYQKML